MDSILSFCNIYWAIELLGLNYELKYAVSSRQAASHNTGSRIFQHPSKFPQFLVIPSDYHLF